MAKTYVIFYETPAGKYKNSFAEAEHVGAALCECVTKVLHSYGAHFISDGDRFYPLRHDLYKENEAFHCFTSAEFGGKAYSYGAGRLDVSFTNDKKLYFYFGVDPLIKENSNDEIITDIKNMLVEYGILTPGAPIYSSDEVYKS